MKRKSFGSEKFTNTWSLIVLAESNLNSKFQCASDATSWFPDLS